MIHDVILAVVTQHYTTRYYAIRNPRPGATGLGYDMAFAQRPGRADGCLIGWLPKLRQGHGFVFENLKLPKL